jgi:hypothetical protein
MTTIRLGTRRFLLAAATALCATGPAQAAEPPVLTNPTTLSGKATSARFLAGVTADEGASYAISFFPDQLLDIRAEFRVEPGHVATKGNLYVVVGVAGQFFMRLADGAFVPWSGSVATLQPAVAGISLDASEVLSVVENFAFGPQGLAGLEFTLFLGYDSSAAPGELYFSGSPATFAIAQAGPALTYVPQSTVKVEQIIGDCDREVQARNGTCLAIPSQTVSRYNIAATDLGPSFEADGRMIIMFGDTIGANPQQLGAADPFAYSTSTNPAAPMRLDFFTDATGTAPLFIRLPGIPMGLLNVPNAGIYLDNTIYMILNVGADANLVDVNQNARSILVRFNEPAKTFTELRPISSHASGGKFVYTSLAKSGSDVMIFGNGDYRSQHLYLAKVSQANFVTGNGTQYFTGLVNGQPTWSSSESDAVPVVEDNPLKGPVWPNREGTIGNNSVHYVPALGVWIMTYDGGREQPTTAGIYFTYAAQPWGPWATPQLIYNLERDPGRGIFIHDPGASPPDNLQGLVFGTTDSHTAAGGVYAPHLMERFTTVSGDRLRIYWTASTWNPYVVLRMMSELTITTVP